MSGLLKTTAGRRRLFIFLCAASVFLLFFLISWRTPPSGDDWVYATGGRYNNPVAAAAHMYMIWSGRFLSELYGYIFAPCKMLWNILNACLFCGIFMFSLRLSKNGETPRPMSCLLMICLMLSVSNHMRMQTYTWMMGTTYIIPLFLILLYFCLLEDWLFHGKDTKARFAAMLVLNAAVPLYMENAAALLCGGNLLAVLWLFFRKDRRKYRMVLLFVTAFAASLIILLSPGAHQRLVTDNAAFSSLSLFEKIRINWPYLVERTFREQVSVRILYVLLAVFTLLSFGRKPVSVLSLLFLVCLFHVPDIVYLVSLPAMAAVYVLSGKDPERKIMFVFILLCALGANAIMVVSPIFDSRSSVYTCYLFFILILILAEDLMSYIFEHDRIPYRSFIAALAAVCLAVVLGAEVMKYYHLYSRVHMITVKRNSEIDYYHANRDEADAWMIAYPDEMIQSPNVVEGDETHDYYFKEYYGLDHDILLHFYYLEDYSEESLLRMLKGE